MARDKVVPVVIKLLTEQDNSLDSAVAAVSAKIKTLQGNVGESVGSVMTQAAEKTAAAVSRAIRPETIRIFSERAVAETESAIKKINFESSSLTEQLKKVEAQNRTAFNAGLIEQSAVSVTKLKTSSEALSAQNIKITEQLVAQKDAAEKLKAAPPADYVQVKAQYQSAQILTKQLQAEAELIKTAYQEAFGEVNKQIKKAASEQEKANKELNKTVKEKKERIESPGAAISERAAELRLARLSAEAADSTNRVEQRRIKVLADQVELQKLLNNVKKDGDKASLLNRFDEATALNNRAAQSRVQATDAIVQAERAAQEHITAIKNGATAQEQGRLRVAAEQAKIQSQRQIADAKKLETEYNVAFKKISSDAQKAGKDIQESMAGTKSSNAFNFLAPLSNQFSGALDSLLGSLGSKLGMFRTTVGTQIGLSVARGVQEGTKNFDFSDNSLKKFFESLDDPAKQLIMNIGTGLVVASGAAAAAMGALIGVTTQVAGRFEAMQAQLVTSFKDPTLAAERFREAVELAAKTPFDVEQVVRAEVSLAARGEKSLAVLKDVTELAAAQNRDLNETAIAVGHAAEGSVRGYEALRNSFGVTTSRLKEFGAVVDTQNRIMVRNEYQINRNREALLNLIRSDFGGGVERLSRTLLGMQSNLRDEVEKVSASFGNIFLPTMKTAIQFATDLLNKINAIPDGMKYLIAGSIVATGAIASLILALGTASLAVGGLTALTSGLLAIPAVAGMGAFAGALSLIGTAAGYASTGLAALTAAVPALTLLAAATVIVNSAIKDYEDHAIKSGQETLEFSKQMADAKRISRELGNEINKTFQLPESFKLDVNNTAVALKQLKDLIQGKGTLGVVADLASAGVKKEELIKELQDKVKAVDKLKASAKELQDVYDKINAAASQEGGLIDKNQTVGGYTVAIGKTLTQILGDGEKAKNLIMSFPSLEGNLNATKAAEGLQGLSNHIGNAKVAMDAFGLRITYLREMTGQLSRVDSAFGALTKSITRTQGFTQFAVASKDVSVLNTALEQERSLYLGISEQLKALTQDHKVSAESVSKYSAQGSDSAKALAQAYFKTRENIIQLNTALLKNKAEDVKTEIEAIDLIGNYRVASRKKNEREQKLSDTQAQLALVKGNFDAYEQLHTQYVEIRERIKTTADHAERDRLTATAKFMEDELKILASGAKEEIKLMREVSTAENAIRANTVLHTKDAISDMLNSIKQQASGEKPIGAGSFFIGDQEVKSINNARNLIKESGGEALSADDKIKVYREGIKKLNEVVERPKVKELRKESVELDRQIREAFRTLEEGITKADIQKPIDNFKKLQNAIKLSTETTEDLGGKLRGLIVAERAVTDARARGQINNKDAEKELVDIAKQRHDIQGQITRAYESQLAELSKLRDKEIGDEIKILELKKNNPGADIQAIDSEILGRKKQQIQAEFQTLRQEREKEIENAKKNGQSQELILEKYRMKESGMIKAAYLEFAKAEEDKFKAVEDRLKKEQAEVDKYKEKRTGGKNSPLISLEELGFQSTLPGFGMDLYANKTKPFDNKTPFNYGDQQTGRGGNELLTYEAFRAQYEAKNNLKTGKGPAPLPSAYDDIKPITQSSVVTNTVYINGSSTNDKDIIDSAVTLTNRALKKKADMRQTFSGNFSGGLSTPDNAGTPGHGPPLTKGVPGY